MTPQEIAAFRAAKDLLLRASAETWRYVNLGPFFKGEGERREGLSELADLTVLPDEIAGLANGVILELRGTKIHDLRPLQKLKGISVVNFDGIPASAENDELGLISKIPDDDERRAGLQDWLSKNVTEEPPELVADGPQFQIDDDGPIRLADFPMNVSDDSDQFEMKAECERKSKELLQTVETAANIAPNLPPTVERYLKLMQKEAADIGARAIWSVANSLEAAIETHNQAQRDGRLSEELPAPIATKLNDLVQTHRVWFLGHPGAREVEARASRHANIIDADEHRRAAASVVLAASASKAVEKAATQPALENLASSEISSPAGVAALGELEEWAWNFIASISRKALLVAKAPPGGFIVQTVAGYYIVDFIVQNEPSLRSFAVNVMTQGPLWWDAMMATLRRASVGDSNRDDG